MTDIEVDQRTTQKYRYAKPETVHINIFTKQDRNSQKTKKQTNMWTY